MRSACGGYWERSSAKIKTIDSEKTQASGLVSPIVEIGSSLIQNIEKNTLETDFQKQILQNSIDEEKQAKIEKRLQEMESKMANLMEKEGRIKQHQKTRQQKVLWAYHIGYNQPGERIPYIGATI